MKQYIKKKFYLVFALIFLFFLIGCSTITNNNIHKNNDKKIEIANPASTNCVDKGYNLTFRTNSNGSQIGYCVFPNGRECEEWSFFRGECKE